MKALYAGSFDPFTIGHLDIACRALKIFDELVIGIGYNESKQGELSAEERLTAIKRVFAGNPAVTVATYQGLTADFAKNVGADVLIRGVRNGTEFEKEKELADINLAVSKLTTVMIPSRPELSFISSSMVRELSHNGYDVSGFIAKPNNITLPE